MHQDTRVFVLGRPDEDKDAPSLTSSSYLLLSSLELSDTKVYKPWIRALLGTAAHFCEVVVLKLRTQSLTASVTKPLTHWANRRADFRVQQG